MVASCCATHQMRKRAMTHALAAVSRQITFTHDTSHRRLANPPHPCTPPIASHNAKVTDTQLRLRPRPRPRPRPRHPTGTLRKPRTNQGPTRSHSLNYLSTTLALLSRLPTSASPTPATQCPTHPHARQRPRATRAATQSKRRTQIPSYAFLRRREYCAYVPSQRSDDISSGRKMS